MYIVRISKNCHCPFSIEFCRGKGKGVGLLKRQRYLFVFASFQSLIFQQRGDGKEERAGGREERTPQHNNECCFSRISKKKALLDACDTVDVSMYVNALIS